MIEQLESRRLLAGISFSYGPNDVRIVGEPVIDSISVPRVINGMLQVKGTTASDDIRFSQSAAANIVVGRTTVLISADGETFILGNSAGASAGSVVIGSGSLPVGPYVHVRTARADFFVQSAGIRRISVDAGAGDDYVEIEKSLRLHSTLIGARGNDTLVGGTQGDTLSGGAGDDILFGGIGSAADLLDSGPGHDRIASSDRDIVLSSTADDFLVQGVFRTSAQAFRFLNDPNSINGSIVIID